MILVLLIAHIGQKKLTLCSFFAGNRHKESKKLAKLGNATAAGEGGVEGAIALYCAG